VGFIDYKEEIVALALCPDAASFLGILVPEEK